MTSRPPIGVLALQGGFAAHLEALAAADLAAREVRAPRDLEGLGGLILPGGESTAQLRLIGRGQLEGPLRAFAATGKPMLATCAGLILAARAVHPAQPSLGWLDVSVDRNAYGRQLDSFEAQDDSNSHHLVFIRAPKITAVGAEVDVVLRLGGEPVLVRQGRVWGAAYHPELDGSALHAEIFGV